jgi:RNA methyltransferase, TrmH family
MLTKNQIKLISSLKVKKFREEHGLFVVEGAKIVPELLKSSYAIHSIYAKQTWLEENNYLFKGKVGEGQVFETSEKELERISQLSTPNEVVAVVKSRTAIFDAPLAQNNLTLLLDEVKDPGNLGTIIRIADWFGIPQIICSEDSVDVFNSKVIQATMGSFTRVEIIYNNLSEILDRNARTSKIPVFGALLDGERVYTADLPKHGFLIMGNESRGISAPLLPFIDRAVSIPSFGGAESLNVSIAAAILCSEFRRREG